MTKVAWFCIILLAIVGIAFVPWAVSVNDNTASSRTDEKILKVNGFAVNLDDYQPVDPSPCSKAVKPGPTPRGAPAIPYIPRFSPPNNPIYVSYP